MKSFIKISILMFLFVGFLACKKNQTGGKASLEGVVAHHGKPIANAHVYVKFKATEFPGEDYTNYDTYVQADADGYYKISFYKGDYYIFARGYDMDVPAPHIVQGGLSVSLRNKEHLKKDIAVTED